MNWKIILMSFAILGGLVCAVISCKESQYLIGCLSFFTILAPAVVWYEEYQAGKKQQAMILQLKDKIENLGLDALDSPEWLWVIVDSMQHVLFGIKHDGTIDWSLGIPKPINQVLDRLEQRVKDLEENKSCEHEQ